MNAGIKECFILKCLRHKWSA